MIIFLLCTGIHAAIAKDFSKLLHWQEHDQEAANAARDEEKKNGGATAAATTPVKKALTATEIEDNVKRVTRSAAKGVKKDE